MFERKRERPEIDARLVPYLEAQDEDAAREACNRLFYEYLEGMIGWAVRRQTGVHLRRGRIVETEAADTAADLFQDVATDMFEKLEKMRLRVDEPIARLEPFVLETAKNRFINYLGEKSPHRKKIKQGMYEYVERERNSDGSVLMWNNGEGKVYGLAEHYGCAVVANDNYKLLTQAPEEFKARFFSPKQVKRWKLYGGGDAVKGKLIVELLRAILGAVGGPVEANRLEEAIVQMTGGDSLGTIQRVVADEGEDSDEWEGMTPVSEPTQVADTLGKEVIPYAWQKICSWGVTRRRAYLLMEKSADDLLLFIVNGISEQQMADALKMPLEEFRAVRDRLPLNSRELGELFAAKPRNFENAVSKARKSILKSLADLFSPKKKVED